MWTERLLPAHPRAEGNVLRGHDRARLRRFRGARRRDRGRGGGPGRASRQHQRGASAGERRDQDRAGSHEVSRRHAGADRLREGWDRQAGRAVRHRRDASPALVEVLRREAHRAVARQDGRRARRRAGPAAGVRMVRAVESGGPASAAERRGGPWHAHGAADALSAGHEAIRSRRSAHARIAGRLDRRGRWLFDVAHNPDGMRALVPRSALPISRGRSTALVSILGDKEWPEMLVQLDQVLDHGVLTIAPTAAGPRLGHRVAPALAQGPARPPARAAWTLIPDFARRRGGPEGAGTVLVTGSFHTVGDVMSRARALGSLTQASRLPLTPRAPLYSPHENQGPAGLSRLLPR